jgi:hypothetical protein
MAYSQSKTANILFTVALARRFDSTYMPELRGYAYALHPGTIRTPLVMDSIFGMLFSFLVLLLDFVSVSVLDLVLLFCFRFEFRFCFDFCSVLVLGFRFGFDSCFNF